MSMMEYRIAAMGLVFLGGCLGGLLPLRIAMSEKGHRMLDLGNAFAGGIFLAVGFVHLLGDALENFSQAAPDMNFPLPFLICGLAYLAVLWIEKVWFGGQGEQAIVGKPKFYPFLLLFVLSLHSTIAGVSVGMEGSLSASLVLLIAILAHKSSAAFALGVSLRKIDTPPGRYCGLIALFSTMTPLGIGLGAMFVSVMTGQAAAWGETIFDSLAAGTFLYIAVADILDEVFGNPRDRFKKFSLTLIAFFATALLAVWV